MYIYTLYRVLKGKPDDTRKFELKLRAFFSFATCKLWDDVQLGYVNT